MRKIIIALLIFAGSHWSFTVKIAAGASIISGAACAQNVTTYVDNINHKYVWYVTNSPSNYPGACKILGTVNSDTLFIKNQHVVFDTVGSKNNHIQNMQFIWCDGSTGEMKVSRQDSLMKLLNNSLAFISNTVTVPSPLNGAGFVKTVGASISYDNSTYLTTEVDGSVSNEIQTLSGTGTQTITLSSGGTFVIPTQTTGIISNITPTLTGSTGISIATSGESYSVTNTIPDKTVTITGATGIDITSSYPAFTITPTARISNTVTRSLVSSTGSSGFSISATKDYNVVYSIFAQAASALAGTNTAEVYLELCLTSGGTYTTIAGGPVVSVSGVLSTNGGVICLLGFIPAGYFLRIRTAATGANSGSAVFTYKYGNENSY